ncbi:MAG: TetR family transcriptional regulator [Rhodobacteraceae bacterium]|nr:TetR family transcriptional regulator [Paracoccaceae bacterium]
MARAAETKGQTRIQREKTEQILEAALEVFARNGYRGSTIDQIAAQSGLSKPNILYYFDGKQAIHGELLGRLLDTWLEPLEHLKDNGDPVEEICAYVTRKLEMARDYPRESRLFANEILQGAPHIIDELTGPLKTLTDEKAALIRDWISAKKIADVDPHHLIFSIWAATQHYADFDVQVQAVLGSTSDARFETAQVHLDRMFRAMLQPK